MTAYSKHVRPMNYRDLEEIMAQIETRVEDSRKYTLREYKDFLKSQRYSAWVVEDCAEVVGILVIRQDHHNSCRVMRLMTRESYCNTDIINQLLDKVPQQINCIVCHPNSSDIGTVLMEIGFEYDLQGRYLVLHRSANRVSQYDPEKHSKGLPIDIGDGSLKTWKEPSMN